MLQPDNEKSWYAFKIFFGKGKPIKAYFVTNEIEHIYDVKPLLSRLEIVGAEKARI